MRKPLSLQARLGISLGLLLTLLSFKLSFMLAPSLGIKDMKQFIADAKAVEYREKLVGCDGFIGLYLDRLDNTFDRRRNVIRLARSYFSGRNHI